MAFENETEIKPFSSILKGHLCDRFVVETFINISNKNNVLNCAKNEMVSTKYKLIICGYWAKLPKNPTNLSARVPYPSQD